MKRLVLKKASIAKKIIWLFSMGFTVACLILVYYFFHFEKSMIEKLLLKQAQTLFNQIQIARHWNAEHGGVYAVLPEGEKPNPYLYKVGPSKDQKGNLTPLIVDQKGRELALINPAIMTRELALETKRHSEINFHLTSLNLINPSNKADDFEENALKSFETGALMQMQYVDINDQPYFRYMAPLKVDEACLKCHGFQGYKVGDVRGGISVSIPIRDELAFLTQTRLQTVFFAITVYFATILLLMYSLRHFFVSPMQQLVAMGENIGNGKLTSTQDLSNEDEMQELSSVLIASDKKIATQKAELQAYANKMNEMAYNDPLTELPNRMLFFDRMTATIKQAERYPNGFAVLFIDLDRFKEVNDNLGHAIGDQLLVEVSTRLQACLRSMDTAARIGGDEFAIILTRVPADKHTTESVARKIIKELSRSFNLNGTQSYIGCSIGIAMYPADGNTPEELLRKADEAMYAVKQSGRNNFLFYHMRWMDIPSMSNANIDMEHQSLLKLIDKFNETILSHYCCQTQVIMMLEQIKQETIEHFAHEEMLFNSSHFPETEVHTRCHQQIIQKLNQIIENIQQVAIDESNGQQIWIENFLIIKDLIISHMLKEDCRYIQYIKQTHS